MSEAVARAPKDAVGKLPFRNRYKLQGTIAALVVMWLDFAYVHHGLLTNDPGAVGIGMVVMLAGAATAYYFG